MKATVIIITLNRPTYVRRCLGHLAGQTRLPDETIVVDASSDELTRDVVEEFAGVVYLRNREGFGRMTTSRNIGLKQCSGDVIAFIDDDAFAGPGWLDALLSTYTDPTVGAVGGRARNNVPGEESYRVDQLGKLKANGELAGYFGANPGRVIEVDHIMGCNMSFRRELLGKLGGFREDYPGISGVCEDSDMSMRVRRLGFRILFNPEAVVDHVGAPQVKGKRFDARYAYFGQRNHIVLLMRNFGFGSRKLWLYLFHSVYRDSRRIAGAIYRAARDRKINSLIGALGGTLGDAGGTLAGIVAGVDLLRIGGCDPIRYDQSGREIARTLLRSSSADDAAMRGPISAAV